MTNALHSAILALAAAAALVVSPPAWGQGAPSAPDVTAGATPEPADDLGSVAVEAPETGIALPAGPGEGIAERNAIAPVLPQSLVPSDALATARERAERYLVDGGPAMWAIAGLSVFTLALILWKIWRFLLVGA